MVFDNGFDTLYASNRCYGQAESNPNIAHPKAEFALRLSLLSLLMTSERSQQSKSNTVNIEYATDQEDMLRTRKRLV